MQADPRAPLLVYVGRLTGQKGVDVILSAAPALLGPAPGVPPLQPSAGATWAAAAVLSTLVWLSASLRLRLLAASISTLT